MPHWLLRLLAFLLACTPVHAQKVEPVSEKPLRPEDRTHWAFQPPKPPPVPTVRDSGWIRTPVDTFILARLEAAGLPPSPPAGKLALLRRAYLDLVGLPPSPEEQDAFLADSSPGAFEKVVDRLLTSPQYGERWAQHWLDVVRFAESNGYEGDGDRPHAWRYRDYVAASFNADKPYNRFLTEQLAGDELAAGNDPRTAAELWVATGLNRCGPVHVISGNVDPEPIRQEVLTEYVWGVGAAVLGLTINCARCHDHKFDPVSQADYYRLQAFFAGAQFKEVEFATPEEKKAHDAKVAGLQEKIKPLKAQVEAIDGPHRKRIQADKKAKLEPMYRAALDADPKKRTEEQKQLAKDAETLIKVTWDEIHAALSPLERAKREALRNQQHALEAQLPGPVPAAWAIADDGKNPPTHVLKRGEVKRKGGVVEPAFPRVLTPEVRDQKSEVRLKRSDLAKWVTQPDHPLTARVIMNRVWQHHFGRGIVGTPNDFGLRGEKPTHPELLDYLATEFMAKGWQLKPIHRMIVLSATYQQTSQIADLRLPIADSKTNRQSAIGNPQSVDPDNKLLWRMNRQRLDGEELRDSVLAAAGTLTRQVGGPSVRVPLEPEVYDLIFTEGEPDGLWHANPDPAQHTRRSLYLLAKRNVRLPMLEAFDQPDRLTPCAGRAVSTFAPQALILMNGPFTQQQSRAMAASLLRECGPDVERQVTHAYRRAFGRPPAADEMRLAKEFLSGQSELAADRLRARLSAGVPDGLPAGADVPHAVALADFCLALFNANEFAYGP
ncbi:MAG: DUF1553 domain-containing protein [Zavarzinella sp.]|nr:DUF1553 domain-containing protein [Zavarzinella sp.]